MIESVPYSAYTAWFSMRVTTLEIVRHEVTTIFANQENSRANDSRRATLRYPWKKNTEFATMFKKHLICRSLFLPPIERLPALMKHGMMSMDVLLA